MTPYEEEKQIYRGWTHEELEELMAPFRARIAELEAALTQAKPFFDEDFPDGPDGPCAVTSEYRQAYKAILAALARRERLGP